jgi:hypothetical protein
MPKKSNKHIQAYDRQAYRASLEQSKRDGFVYAQVVNFGWFFADPFRTHPRVLDMVYEEAAGFLDEHLMDYLYRDVLKKEDE